MLPASGCGVWRNAARGPTLPPPPLPPVVQSGFWCVIDCEFARRIGKPIPSELKVRCDWATDCSAATDLYLVGQMLEDLAQLCQQDAELEQLKSLLRSKSRCFDVELNAEQVARLGPGRACAPPRVVLGGEGLTEPWACLCALTRGSWR